MINQSDERIKLWNNLSLSFYLRSALPFLLLGKRTAQPDFSGFLTGKFLSVSLSPVKIQSQTLARAPTSTHNFLRLCKCVQTHLPEIIFLLCKLTPSLHS